MSDPIQTTHAEHEDNPVEVSIPIELLDYPRATAEERITSGMPIEDMVRLCGMIGRGLGDADDGFEEEIRALRRGFRTHEPWE